VSLLSSVCPNSDLGYPMCYKLRKGNWMIGKFHFRLTNILHTACMLLAYGNCVCVCARTRAWKYLMELGVS